LALRDARVVRDYTGVGMRPGRHALIAGVVIAVLATSAGAQLPGLARLRQVDIAVDVDHPLDFMTPEDLSARLQDRLGQVESSILVSDRSTDRIRLTVAVRPTSASTLRGFWLPFSGTYAVGAVRLGVERLVTMPGPPPRSFPAIVWQTERIVGVPWHAAEREISRVLDEMVAELLDARRQAG
jgi:hypothetical protein